MLYYTILDDTRLDDTRRDSAVSQCTIVDSTRLCSSILYQTMPDDPVIDYTMRQVIGRPGECGAKAAAASRDRQLACELAGERARRARV